MKEELHVAFEKFVSKYDEENKMIKLKHLHSYRVASLSEMLAIKQGLEARDVYMAYVLGLLHDIGRFKQVSDYDSNDDKLFDHGDFGAYLLFDKGLITSFYDDKSNYTILQKAIGNHNKKSVTGSYSPREEIFIKLIRDADKLDIFYLFVFSELLLNCKQELVTPHILKSFLNYQAIDYHDLKTLGDQLLLYLALVFDLNYIDSFIYLKQKNYINKIINNYNNQETGLDLEKIKTQVNNYIDKRIGENNEKI